MIDNFDLIEDILSFNSDDEFYFVQIIQRKKDNPGTSGRNNKNRTVKSYRITSKKMLSDLKEEMIELAKVFNARVGINLNKRSFEKTAFNTLVKIAGQMNNRDYKSVKSAYDSCCGIHNAISDKMWLLDIDNIKDISEYSPLYKFITECEPVGKKTIAIIPSKSGFHLITKPFNLIDFGKEYPDIEIHKNNPTNLYIL